VDSIVTDEAGVWIAGGISPWEIIGFMSELDMQIDHGLGPYSHMLGHFKNDGAIQNIGMPPLGA